MNLVAAIVGLLLSEIERLKQALNDKYGGPPTEAFADALAQLRRNLRDDKNQGLLSQLEYSSQALQKQHADGAGAIAHLEEEMEKLSGRDTAAADESGRFSAIPSDFKLSYGNHEEYDKGLSALVGAPVANAGKLEEALQEEHAMDEPFMIWSNQFKNYVSVRACVGIQLLPRGSKGGRPRTVPPGLGSTCRQTHRSKPSWDDGRSLYAKLRQHTCQLDVCRS